MVKMEATEEVEVLFCLFLSNFSTAASLKPNKQPYRHWNGTAETLVFFSN